MKQKTCKICKEKFTPTRQLQPTCQKIECMSEYALRHLSNTKKLQTKSRNKAKKEFNESDRSYLLKKAQTIVNRYIRMRDGKKCISCGYEGIGRQFHAGHYRPQGGNSALRFHHDNINSQCSICNTHLSGNLAEYRKALIEKIGLPKVEQLESMNNIKKWSVEELQIIIDDHRRLIKELKDNMPE